MATTIHVEQALLGQVKQRDREAFLELYDRTIMDVSRLVAFLLDDPSGIEDVIQVVANCYGKRDLTWQNVVQGSIRGR